MSVLFIFSQKITMSSTPPEMRSTSVHTDKCIEIQLVFPSSRRHLDIYQTVQCPKDLPGLNKKTKSIQVVKQVQKQKQYRDKTRPLLDSRHLYRKHYIRRGSSSVVQPSNFVSEWDLVGSHLDQTKFWKSNIKSNQSNNSISR